MASRLQTQAFGPFVRLIDTGNPAVVPAGTARALTNLRLVGANQLQVRPGTRVVCTLVDDQVTPAPVDTVCAIVPFADGCLAVGWSASQTDCYLYRLDATLQQWQDSSGAWTDVSASDPAPIGVLWSGMPDPPEVTIAEGLGVAYLAHAAALDATALAFPLKAFTDSTQAIATVTSDLDGDTSAEDLYPLGVISFQQHLWMWGFGAGITASGAYRPELARFSQPNFDATTALFAGSDSITLGNRVRSRREGIVGAAVAGDALFLGAPYLVSRVTGYGRSSWIREPVEQSFGFVSHKCAVAVGAVCYYWSPRGPMRIGASGPAEPLFDAVAGFVARVTNPQTVLAGFDAETDTVLFVADTGSGVRTAIGYDVRRDTWTGPDNDLGLALRAVGAVQPIYLPTAAATTGPSDAPTDASTNNVTATSARANWTAGDLTSPTVIRIRQQGSTPWTTLPTLPAGVSAYTFTGLAAATAYEWDVTHWKDGLASTSLGPSTDTQFTTDASSSALAPPTGLSLSYDVPSATLTATWINSGESSVRTVVELADDGTTFITQGSVDPGVASYPISITAAGTYTVRIHHTRSGATDSSTVSEALSCPWVPPF